MAEEKLCPLKFTIVPRIQEINRTLVVDKRGFNCNRECCAWWMNVANCCSIKQFASDLNHISNHSMFQ